MRPPVHTFLFCGAHHPAPWFLLILRSKTSRRPTSPLVHVPPRRARGGAYPAGHSCRATACWRRRDSRVFHANWHVQPATLTLIDPEEPHPDNASFAPTGASTIIEQGGFPIKHNADGSVAITAKPREARVFNGRKYAIPPRLLADNVTSLSLLRFSAAAMIAAVPCISLQMLDFNFRFIMEEAIRGDFAFVKAWKGDTAGELQRHRLSRQSIFRSCVCVARACLGLLTAWQAILCSNARRATSIPWLPPRAKSRLPRWSTLSPQVPALRLQYTVRPRVPDVAAFAGSLDPDEIHVPGIYVSRLYQPPSFEKRIERLTLQKEPGSADGKGLGVRERIVKRAAKELKDGMCGAYPRRWCHSACSPFILI